MGWSGNSNKWTLSVHDIIAPANIKNIVAYFCHHLSENYLDLSDLYVDLSVIYVNFSDHYVDFSEKHHHNKQLNILC